MSNVAAAKALGCGVNTVTNYLKPGWKIPRYIALACAAISHGLPPMGGAV
jgi:hypothetical protein